jgi:ketosteroid isomerase-like protein
LLGRGKKIEVVQTMKILIAILLAMVSIPALADDEKAIRELEERWDVANLNGDAAVLDAIFADTFISTDDEGKVRTKSEMLSALRSRDLKYESAKTDEVKIILHGDAAVVSGRWRGKYVHKAKSVELVERFTNYYARRNGRWLCVASHGSAIK